MTVRSSSRARARPTADAPCRASSASPTMMVKTPSSSSSSSREENGDSGTDARPGAWLMKNVAVQASETRVTCVVDGAPYRRRRGRSRAWRECDVDTAVAAGVRTRARSTARARQVWLHPVATEAKRLSAALYGEPWDACSTRATTREMDERVSVFALTSLVRLVLTGARGRPPRVAKV